MTGRERIVIAPSHEDGPLAVDFSGSPTTGIHVSIVGELRRYYGFEEQPVAVWDPYQMLGDLDDDLAKIMHVDVMRVHARKTLFGFENHHWKPWRTSWGQEFAVSRDFQVGERSDGSVVIYPQGDRISPTIWPDARRGVLL